VHTNIIALYIHIFILILSSILNKISFENKSITDSEEKKSGKIIINIIFISSMWVLIEFIQDLLFNLIIFDYWILGLLIISIVNSKLFKFNLYKHQKVAIFFNLIISFIFQLSSFILLIQKYDNEYIYIKYKWLIPISIVIQFFLNFVNAYIIAKLNWLMESKYISPHKLLIFYGFIGIIIYFISCIIASFLKCHKLFKDNICEVSRYEDEDDDYYIENIFVYLEKLSNIDKIKKAKKIIIFFLGIIFNSLFLYYEVLINKYLSPVHCIFYHSIEQFFNSVINLIINITLNMDYEKEIILNIVGNLLNLIGFLIYLEIIELNFCQLNYNLRKYIE